MDKINVILNLVQIACFFGIGYFLGKYHMPTIPFISIIVFALVIDVLSSWQGRRDEEKKYE